MGKRPTRRGHGGGMNIFPLWLPETKKQWRVAREVSFASGEAKCASGEWGRVRDAHDNLAGYQVLASSFKSEESLPCGATSTSISVRELLMSAGCFGKSRTMRMTEEQRLARHAPFDPEKLLPPEDAVERAIAKVRQWPHPASRVDDGGGEPVYGDRATRVYPHA